ncbi:MAG: hypothetical protein PHV34_01410 [Verrucomicrobiae bacterium]|nr:hypothetical protein [Verrucomicrobiae bacterium]
MNPIEKPRVVAAGLSIDIYRTSFPDYVERASRQLDRFLDEIVPFADILSRKVCLSQDDVTRQTKEAGTSEADALLLIPLSYTPSLMSVPPLLKTRIPIVIWNTQEDQIISENYNSDTLLMNHVTQGTQDVTNVLLRNGRRFGMESGHYLDRAALDHLREWLEAAKTLRFAKRLRAGLLGQPFQDMGDFGFDESFLASHWGPAIIRLSPGQLARIIGHVDEKQVSECLARDREQFDVAEEITEEIHRTSIRLELGVRQMVADHGLDAFSMNFLELIEDGRFPTMPFLGINKLLGEGLGYAGEGNITIAAHMAQMRQLCGAANFTEIYTVDYASNRMMMTHMQECNPALARKDRKVRLVRKDFWAPGMGPYVGMHFTLEPGPATLTCMTPDAKGNFLYIAHETAIRDMAPLPKFDIPHWMVELNEPAGDFLTRYSMAGGMHHLVSVPGKQVGALRKLAHLQGFNFVRL